jgi:hypothetical protein
MVCKINNKPADLSDPFPDPVYAERKVFEEN